jgi:putative transposase
VPCINHCGTRKAIQATIAEKVPKMLQEEFPEPKKSYWGKHLWSTGYFCEAEWEATDEMVKEYIERQKGENIDRVFKITE